MTLGAKLALGALVAVLFAWFVLRLTKPQVEKKFRGAFVGGAGALAGAALVLIGLKKKPKPGDELDERKPADTLKETESRYETDDDFDELAERATSDELVRAPDVGGDIDDELADFRAGSDELVD